jgi:glucosamine-6-phosphate deaminase
MEKLVFNTKRVLGEAAAQHGIAQMKEAIGKKGYANIILATGASQFEMLEVLTRADIDWSVVTAFHLDEYIGIPLEHPASFRKYLKERFVEQVKNLKAFHYIDGNTGNPEEVCADLGEKIGKVQIDVAFIGIGENGHLAFNDPPADFSTEKPYLVVTLDEPCRKQQLGEGWFKTLNDVPRQAISMSIKQILKSSHLVCTVPDARKAEAVKCAVEGEVSPECPASILRTHENCALFLDTESASLLTQ